MTGVERRNKIVEEMKNSSAPMSGGALAEKLQVSRQIIVQDIALIRAAGYDVIATHRGYILNDRSNTSRVFKVQHSDEQIEDELYTIVDLGGTVKNVMVNHRVYGQMEAELNIRSRRQAQEFMNDIKSGKSSPLKNITSNYHYHTIEADSEQTLDLIEQALREKDFLIETK